MIADVPLGAFLSGGTDSSLVVACMTDAAPEVRTFSIGFTEPEFDESRWSEGVATSLGTRHTQHRMQWREALDLVPRLGEIYDEPFGDSSALPTMVVSRLARQSVTVALSGDGGDELFGGYTRYVRAHGLQRAGAVPAPVLRGAGRMLGPTALGRRLRLAAQVVGVEASKRYEELVSLWRSPQLAALMPDVPLEQTWALPQTDGGPPVTSMMRRDARTYLVDDILQKVDRASMAVSLEVRNPLLDPEVVELGMRASPVAEAHPGEKRLLRDALRLRLPNELVDRPKLGFGVPVGKWLREDLRELVEDLILARSDPEYDAVTAHAVCREHLAGTAEATPQVWSLLAYELWRQRW
jgi:asparagine synthase (glutamine-hydrolysing)